MSNVIWPYERVKDLEHRWNILGQTSGQIAAVYNLSRQAINSKVNRLRESGTPMAERMSSSARRGGTQKKRAMPAAKPAVALMRLAAPQTALSQPETKPRPAGSVPPVIGHKIVYGAAKAIAALRPDQCRWPIGDTRARNFHFCNSKRVPLLSYCECHARDAFQPPRQRKRDQAAASAPVAPQATHPETAELTT